MSNLPDKVARATHAASLVMMLDQTDRHADAHALDMLTAPACGCKERKRACLGGIKDVIFDSRDVRHELRSAVIIRAMYLVCRNRDLYMAALSSARSTRGISCDSPPRSNNDRGCTCEK